MTQRDCLSSDLTPFPIYNLDERVEKIVERIEQAEQTIAELRNLLHTCEEQLDENLALLSASSFFASLVDDDFFQHRDVVLRTVGGKTVDMTHKLISKTRQRPKQLHKPTNLTSPTRLKAVTLENLIPKHTQTQTRRLSITTRPLPKPPPVKYSNTTYSITDGANLSLTPSLGAHNDGQHCTVHRLDIRDPASLETMTTKKTTKTPKTNPRKFRTMTWIDTLSRARQILRMHRRQQQQQETTGANDIDNDNDKDIDIDDPGTDIMDSKKDDNQDDKVKDTSRDHRGSESVEISITEVSMTLTPEWSLMSTDYIDDNDTTDDNDAMDDNNSKVSD